MCELTIDMQELYWFFVLEKQAISLADLPTFP